MSTARPAQGASFALGAKGRLLPLSIPMRFFGAAALFQLVAWIGVGAGAAQLPRFAESGGLGAALAALHAVTLGMLAMSAIGASLQLMPVATRQPLHSHALVRALWWLYAPGVAVLVAGMAAARPAWMAAGAVPAIVALALYALLLARNLAGARGTMPGVRAMGWIALASLGVALASAGALVAVWAGAAAWPRQGLLMLHIVFAVFGFMGALALGLSNILVPMFALGAVPAERAQLGIAALLAAALALSVPVALDVWPRRAALAAVALGLAAALWHLHTMRAVLRAGMRRELGGSFRLVRLAWALLLATLALAAWWAFDGQRAWLAGAVVICAVAGWLLTFLLGILQRIVPFLVSMHLAGTQLRAPTPSALTHERALTLHRRGHLAALALLAAAIVAERTWLVAGAALAGAGGAVAFGVFFARALRRTRAMRERV